MFVPNRCHKFVHYSNRMFALPQWEPFAIHSASLKDHLLLEENIPHHSQSSQAIYWSGWDQQSCRYINPVLVFEQGKRGVSLRDGFLERPQYNDQCINF